MVICYRRRLARVPNTYSRRWMVAPTYETSLSSSRHLGGTIAPLARCSRRPGTPLMWAWCKRAKRSGPSSPEGADSPGTTSSSITSIYWSRVRVSRECSSRNSPNIATGCSMRGAMREIKCTRCAIMDTKRLPRLLLAARIFPYETMGKCGITYSWVIIIMHLVLYILHESSSYLLTRI